MTQKLLKASFSTGRGVQRAGDRASSTLWKDDGVMKVTVEEIPWWGSCSEGDPSHSNRSPLASVPRLVLEGNSGYGGNSGRTGGD